MVAQWTLKRVPIYYLESASKAVPIEVVAVR